jgi:hypothetical protein
MASLVSPLPYASADWLRVIACAKFSSLLVLFYRVRFRRGTEGTARPRFIRKQIFGPVKEFYK